MYFLCEADLPKLTPDRGEASRRARVASLRRRLGGEVERQLAPVGDRTREAATILNPPFRGARRSDFRRARVAGGVALRRAAGARICSLFPNNTGFIKRTQWRTARGNDAGGQRARVQNVPRVVHAARAAAAGLRSLRSVPYAVLNQIRVIDGRATRPALSAVSGATWPTAHVHCWHTVHAGHMWIQKCCRCGAEK